MTAEAVAIVNPKDRHVATTAVTHGADLIVSNDCRLRREINALGRPLRAVTGDEFAQQLLLDSPDGIDAVIGALVAKRTRRPVTRSQFVDQVGGYLSGLCGRVMSLAVEPSRHVRAELPLKRI